MNTLAERLVFAMNRIEPKVKQVDLANACNIKPSSISDWLNGRTKKIEGANLLAAASRLGVSPEWLATGKGRIEPRKQNISILYSNEVKIPIFNAVASMGNGAIQNEYEAIVSEITVTPIWIKEHIKGLSNSTNLAILTGKGDSMQPTFDDGDLLVVDTGVRNISIDGIYVFSINNELYVKRIRKKPSGEIEVSSDNVNFKSHDLY